MTKEKNDKGASHTSMLIIMPCFAPFFSLQVRAVMPRVRKRNLADRLTQTMLTAKRVKAPIARFVSPADSIMPKVTAGGRSATATITPTR